MNSPTPQITPFYQDFGQAGLGPFALSRITAKLLLIAETRLSVWVNAMGPGTWIRLLACLICFWPVDGEAGILAATGKIRMGPISLASVFLSQLDPPWCEPRKGLAFPGEC